MFKISVKRIYEVPSPDDGFRILVDRIWPRGVSKQEAALDLWLKDIAPTTELRQWFHHQTVNEDVWKTFQQRYHDELQGNGEAVQVLQRHCAEHPVTLLYSARDTAHNHAQLLKSYIEERQGA